MSNILEEIKENIVKKANKALGGEQIQVSDLVYPPSAKASGGKPSEINFGDLSLPCFDIAKSLKKKPNEVVEELKNKIKTVKEIEEVVAVGPYLNFVINKEYLSKEVLESIQKEKDDFGKNENLKGKKILVEYAHPNPFKAFHIGHLRNVILGESVCKLLEASGAKVIRANYQGDVGMHIAKCLWAFQKVDKKDYPETSDEHVALIGKCYAEGAKVFEENELIKKEITEINKKIYTHENKEINKLWELGRKWSLDKFHEIFTRLGTKFEREYMESEVMEDGVKYIEEALDKGILMRSQGAIIFDGNKYGLDVRVFMNKEGLPTYEGKELGLAFREFKDFGKIDLCIHNVAVEQISFFKVTFKVQELLDEKLFKGKQYHNAYEFVGLKTGKMSSRKGDVVLGEAILDEAKDKIGKIVEEKSEAKDIKNLDEKIGVGAIKYSFLKVSPFKYLAFDMEESINFSGDSGPYLQYTGARINSIIRKSEIKKFKKADFFRLTESREHDLIIMLAKYRETVEKASKNYDPSEIAKYLFDLAQKFNDYYHSVPVLKSEEDVKLARLALLNSVNQVLKNGLNILGIEAVAEM